MVMREAPRVQDCSSTGSVSVTRGLGSRPSGAVEIGTSSTSHGTRGSENPSVTQAVGLRRDVRGVRRLRSHGVM